MFAEFNYDNFPIVFVTFSENINSENEFDQFLNEWLILYHNRRDFSYIFDTRNMKNISIKYYYYKSKFLPSDTRRRYLGLDVVPVQCQQRFFALLGLGALALAKHISELR